MRTLYNLLFIFFFVFSAPFYFLKMWRRGEWRRGFGERFARYNPRFKQTLTNRHVLWMHAVSVGEVNICTQLIRALEHRLPNIKFVVSTTTSTGMGELRRKLPRHIEKIYFPVDRRRYVEKAIWTIHPEVVVLVEAEIWPNFLWRLQERKIPVFLVNARLSERSYKGYKRFGFLFRPLFASFAGVGVQNELDGSRLADLGCRREAIRVIGNLKFDSAPLSDPPLFSVEALLQQLGVGRDSLILIGGSTHAGEEALLAEIFLRLKRQFPSLFLILVPRHFERGKEVGRQLEERRVKFVYRTGISLHSRHEPGSVECLLVNTTGELKYFYEKADVIFVGKSLSAEGGQNPIEPGALGKAMIFGPNMQNFQAIANSFLKEKGAVQAANAQELEQTLRALLADPEARRRLGRQARKVVRENQGSIEKTVEMILSRMPEEEIYIAPASASP